MDYNEIKFKVVSVNKTRETFEVEWDNGERKKTVNMRLPYDLRRKESVSIDDISEYIKRTYPRDIVFKEENLKFHGETLENMRTKVYTLYISDDEDEDDEIEEEDV